ncbi:hypothetical protein EB796_000999 [Bugula neritina]|uniref:Uncharacterized protein n=1 Tax=Bugula neritina TaxID=10212 RepID=A0A7J7KRI5_BUGNE|nr:hypothetical protein EB796_000999 [Bugula neritina]
MLANQAPGGEATTKKKLKELGFLTQYEKQQKEVAAREAEKKRANVEKKIRKDFPNTPNDLITMALESTNYDEKKVVSLLKSLTTSVSASRPATAASSASRPATAASSASTSGPAASKPSASVAGTSASKPATAVANSGTGKSTQKNLPAKATAIDQALTSHAKEHKRKGQGVKVNETSAKPVVKSKLAVGPDSSLFKGAQDSYLLTAYCEVNGHNPELVHGPTCKPMGSQGAHGPDKSLVHGPSRLHLITV